MNWCHREPTLEEILSEPIILAVMEADGVDPHELEAMLTQITRSSSRFRQTFWSGPRTADTPFG